MDKTDVVARRWSGLKNGYPLIGWATRGEVGAEAEHNALVDAYERLEQRMKVNEEFTHELDIDLALVMSIARENKARYENAQKKIQELEQKLKVNSTSAPDPLPSHSPLLKLFQGQ